MKFCYKPLTFIPDERGQETAQLTRWRLSILLDTLLALLADGRGASLTIETRKNLVLVCGNWTTNILTWLTLTAETLNDNTYIWRWDTPHDIPRKRNILLLLHYTEQIHCVNETRPFVLEINVLDNELDLIAYMSHLNETIVSKNLALDHLSGVLLLF